MCDCISIAGKSISRAILIGKSSDDLISHLSRPQTFYSDLLTTLNTKVSVAINGMNGMLIQRIQAWTGVDQWMLCCHLHAGCHANGFLKSGDKVVLYTLTTGICQDAQTIKSQLITSNGLPCGNCISSFP